MELKYLPIGSVCTLKGKNKKVMVTGYYSVEFNGNLKINDYSGCVYPEGMLLPEQTCTFNHTDIEFVDFVGFKNDEQRKFQSLLDRLTGNDNQIEKASEFHKENDMFLTSNSTYSKLLFDENGVVMIADPVEQKPKKKKESSFKNITFDEKGYVISADTTIVNNPFYKDYKSKSTKDEEKTSKWNIFKKIEFDKDGIVLNADLNDKKEKMLNKFKFDENGIVVSENAETLKEKEQFEKYKFDENGVLISVGDEKLEEQIPAIGPGLPGYNGMNENSEKYEFDENGVLISVGDEKLEEQIPAIGPGLPDYNGMNENSEK